MMPSMKLGAPGTAVTLRISPISFTVEIGTP
jgi:hypothetical protein